MTDTNFRPGSTGASDPGAGIQRGAASASPQGSHEPGYAEHALEQASDMAEDVWRAGQDYYEHGSRRVSRWATEHPNQMWAFVAAASAFALWMAYRPLAPKTRAFDPSRDRNRRLPRPMGREFQRM